MTVESAFRKGDGTGETSGGVDDAERARVDALVSELTVGAQRWANLPLRDRARMLRAIQRGVGPLADAWAEASAQAKHGTVDAVRLGTEYLAGPYALARCAGALAGSLTRLAAGRRPIDWARRAKAPGGREALRVLPLDLKELVLFHGFTAQIWQQPGPLSTSQRERLGLEQRSAGVVAVLSATGVGALALVDALDEVVVRGRAALVKLSPSLAGLIPLYERLLAPLVTLGAVRFLAGTPACIGYLRRHPDIERVRITGNAFPFGSVHWGSDGDGPGGEQRMSSAGSLSAAGGATGIVIAPSRWSAADIRYQARHIASVRRQNVLFGTGSAQVVVVPRQWPQASQLLSALRRELEVVTAETDEQIEALQQRHADESVVGLALLPGDRQAFSQRAVEFGNERLFGALGHMLVIAPRLQRELGPRLLQQLSAIRAGNIGINTWAGFGFLTPHATWGVYPGEAERDIARGVGVTHNGLLVEAPERTVFRGPFRPWWRALPRGEWTLFPTPPWWKGNPNAELAGRLLTRFAVRPSWVSVARLIVGGALRR